MKARSFFLKIVLYINVAAILLLLLSGYSYLINPGYVWWVAALALLFPVFILLNIMFVLFWMIANRGKTKLSLVALILIIPVIFNYIPFNKKTEFKIAKEPTDIRVLTWNVGLMNLTAKDTETAIINNLEILRAIKNSNADVVCLQEFLTSKVKDGHYNFMDSIARTMGYPYKYFSDDHGVKEDFFFSGSIIFSKHPIIEFSKSKFNDDFSGSVIKATIAFNKDTIDVITSRLQSPGFKKDEYRVLNNLKKVDPKAIKGSRSLVRKLKNGYKNRQTQIVIVKKMISGSTHPVIFTADLNDVPNSYAYMQIKGNKRDVWLNKGYGLGRTFRKISPTLRIDYIFSDKRFEVLQSGRILEGGSDHYGLISDLRLN